MSSPRNAREEKRYSKALTGDHKSAKKVLKTRPWELLDEVRPEQPLFLVAATPMLLFTERQDLTSLGGN